MFVDEAEPVRVIAISVPVWSGAVNDTLGILTRLGFETETALYFSAKFAFVCASKTGVFFSIFSLPTVRPNF